MNVIALPTELSNLSINESNINHFIYRLSYFHAAHCINKEPSNNVALDFIKKLGGIGDENDSIYEKFIPISKANLLREKESLGYSFDIMDYDYPNHYIVGEDTYRKWAAALNFEQRIDYKIKSLIEIHGVDINKISEVISDCETLPSSDRADYQLSLLSEIWDNNYYALYDDNIVWGVGYSEIGAFFNALENHVWLEKVYSTEAAGTSLDEVEPYPDSSSLFTEIIELILAKKTKNWGLPNNLALQPCSKAMFNKLNKDGLMEFDFCEMRGLLDIAK